MLIKKIPKITNKSLFFDCSDSFDHRYIETKIIIGILKPKIIYFGILYFNLFS